MTDIIGGLAGLALPNGTAPVKKPNEMPGLALAYIGDAVWEILIRRHLLASGEMKPNSLHKMATCYVNAKAQSKALHLILGTLSEEEAAVMKRGRNAKSGSAPKNADMIDYRHATGFEALIGYLYLQGRYERIQDIAAATIPVLAEQTK